MTSLIPPWSRRGSSRSNSAGHKHRSAEHGHEGVPYRDSNPYQNLQKVTSRLLIVQGTADKLIAPDIGHRLQPAACRPSKPELLLRMTIAFSTIPMKLATLMAPYVSNAGSAAEVGPCPDRLAQHFHGSPPASLN